MNSFERGLSRARSNMAAVFLYFYAPFVVFCGFLLAPICSQKVLCPSNCSCLGSMVDCSKRELKEIPKDLPNWVTILELQTNEIKDIPPNAFENLEKLEQLYLSNNQIKNLNSSIFDHLPNLKTLKLSYNLLTEIPYIPNGSNLTYLILHHNQIEVINGDALEYLPKLRTLDLNFNLISDIPPGTFPTNCSLHQLFLNNNKVGNLENGVLDNLTSLEYLKMNKNKLTVIPKDVFRKMINLKYLELNRNRIRSVEGLSFHGLEKLRVLKLRRNVINQLMDGAFWGLVNIQILKLDNNNLTSVAKGWLYGLSSLQQLSLAHNGITQIDPDGWEFCQLLWELDLTHNKLTGIGTATFDRLKNLSFLYLDYNHVSYIGTGAFKGLAKLQALEMNNNEISWTIEDMNGAFDGLTSLTRLGLDSNRITSIAKKAFFGLDMLKTLHLTDNAIASIQSNAFSAMRSLQELRFNSTNLLCDCHLSWLSEWLIKSGFQSSVNARCGHPEWLKGKSIFEIKLQDFKCEDFPKPVIITEPRSQIALREGNITLQCSVASSSNKPMQYMWKKDNIIIKDADVENLATTGDGRVMRYTTLLHLKNIRDEDEGRYQCIVTNQFGATYSQKAKITVHVFPQFTKTPLDVTVKSGSTARLECAATGQPHPEIAWQKDGGDDFPAARERRMHVMPEDDQFFIVNVKSSDEGVYTCTATNDAGTVVANASLTVLETPSFVKMMKDKQVKAGETAVLECMATGSPKPKLSWLKNGKPLEITPRHFFTAEGQLLIIVQTQQSDSGRYTCEMTNTLGTESDSSELTVIGGEAAQQTGLGGGGGLSDQSTTIGIIIIAVVCCVVGTSLVWVIIIYQTRKKHEEYSSTPTDEITLPVDPSSTGNSYQSSEKDEGHPPSPDSLPHHTLLSFSGHNLESLPNGRPMCNGHVARYLSDLEDMATSDIEDTRPLHLRSASSLNHITLPTHVEHEPLDHHPTFPTSPDERPLSGSMDDIPTTSAMVHKYPSSSSLVHHDQSTLGGYHGTQPPGTYIISPTDDSVHPSHKSECATSPQIPNGGIYSNGALPTYSECSSLSPPVTHLTSSHPHTVNTHHTPNGLESHHKPSAVSPHCIPNGHATDIVLPNRTCEV